MFTRTAKAGAVLLMAAYLSLVAFGNVTDYGANLGFVTHVMTMDTTFRSEASMWRAVHSPALHHAAYVGIVALQAAAALLCWIGGVRLLSRLREPHLFHAAKAPALAGLGLGAFIWFGLFLVVANEWFLMWQSAEWNAKPTAFNLTLLTFLVLIFVASRDNDADA